MIKGNGASDEEILRFQIKKNVTELFKNFLNILEDVADEHDIALNKLNEKLPNEYKNYVELADYLNDSKFEIIRAKILGKGNDCIRNLDEVLKNFNVKVK